MKETPSFTPEQYNPRELRTKAERLEAAQRLITSINEWAEANGTAE